MTAGPAGPGRSGAGRTGPGPAGPDSAGSAASARPANGYVVDLNADLGESYGAWRLGDDEALLEIVTSANIACGFHAGDPLTIRRACASAVARGVTIGDTSPIRAMR